MLYYPTTTPQVFVGTKVGSTITPWALTNAYQTEGTTKPTRSFPSGGFSELVLDVQYTTGGSETNNSVDIILEDSPDNVSWYRLTNEAASSGTSTLTQREFTFVGASAATTYSFSYRIDISYKFLRISCKESGVSSNAGTVFIEGVLAGM